MFIPTTALLEQSSDLPWVNITDYGAVGNSITDDTAAIQTALDAAGGLPVYMPSNPDPSKRYMFTNLKLPSYCKLFGDGLGKTHLKRIVGSTGTAIREKTAGEGNPTGANGMIVGGFTLDGAGTSGDGLSLGAAGGDPVTSGGKVYDIYSVDFPSGAAIYIKGNAAFFMHLWGMASQDGIVFDGDGANLAYAMFAEQNTRYNLSIDEPYSRLFGIQIENSLASNANPLIYCTGGGVLMSGIYLAHDGTGTAKAKLIQLTAYPVTVRDVEIIGAGTYTNGIYSDAGFAGSGVDEHIAEFVVATDSAGSNWRVNASSLLTSYVTGDREKLIAYAARSLGLTYGTSVTADARHASIFRITPTDGVAFTINAPTSALDGQLITYEIRNSTGGALGAITWSGFNYNAAQWTNPATGFRRTIQFWYDGSVWAQLGAPSGDIAL